MASPGGISYPSAKALELFAEAIKKQEILNYVNSKFANKLFSTSRYYIALLGIKVGLIAEKDDKRYYSEVLGGTIGLDF